MLSSDAFSTPPAQALQPSFTGSPFSNGNPFQGPSSFISNSDLHSPELFQHNINEIRARIVAMQTVASNALHGLTTAYHQGGNPHRTDADLATVRDHIRQVSEAMRQSGVGALPVLFADADGNLPSVPDEGKMIEAATQAVKVLFEKLDTNQQSAATVANLLGANVGGRA